MHFGKVLNKFAPDYLKTLSQKTITPNGYFYHYDDGTYDWIYATPSTSTVAKLDGMYANGVFRWRMIKSCFDGITIESGTQRIIFE